MYKHIKAAVASGLLAIGLAVGTGTAAQAGGGYMGHYHGWGGFYLGAHVGAAWKEASWDDISLTNEAGIFDQSGWGGGVHVGYNIQSGNMVFGIEAAYTATDLSSTGFSTVNPAVSYTNEVNGIFTIGPRLGVASGPFLAYVKGGYALADATVSGINTGAPDAFSKDRSLNGWFIGGGFEWMVGPNMALGVEYNYLDFGSTDVRGFTDAAIPYTLTNLDTQMHTVMARISYKFGGHHAPPAYREPLK